MISFILLFVLTGLAYVVYGTLSSLNNNLKKARATGLPYRIVPIWWLNPFWLAIHRLLIAVFFKYLPSSWTTWVAFCVPDSPHDWRYEMFRRMGHDTFLTVSPSQITIFTCDPGVINQITTRRNDFPKPIAVYRATDIYGKSVLSTEGPLWRQHRKAVSPPFTEKNNYLVWLETIDQGSAMLQSWLGADGKGNVTVDRVMDDTMRLSLHVICRAGFGRKLQWPSEDDMKKRDDDKYDDHSKIQNKPEEKDPGHAMSYTYAIHSLLDTILLQFIVPRKIHPYIPLNVFKKARESYNEWGGYMREAIEQKRKEIRSDTKDGIDQMDLLGQLVKGQIAPDKRNSHSLTDSDLLGNMFVLILAGHETAANSIHFTILYLALCLKAQRDLQKDLDQIFQGRPPKEWSYDRDLPQLFGGMAGAVLAEELRLMPPVPSLPKSTWGVSDQPVTIDGKQHIFPAESYIVVATASVHRHPKYWRHSKGSLPGGKTAHPVSNVENDLEEFHPERWLLSEAEMKANKKASEKTMTAEAMTSDGLNVNEASDTSDRLYRPTRGSYIPFSDGYRACIGRRFAQVEVLAVLSLIFQNYSVELAVDKFATDKELDKMNMDEKAEVWQRAAEDARESMLNSTGVIITLQLRGTHIPVRFVPRGQERFPVDVDERWKQNHPDMCKEAKRNPAWISWNSKTRIHHNTSHAR